MLFNEPKLLKSCGSERRRGGGSRGFSALQRAEIAEIKLYRVATVFGDCFSALQRAEIAEIVAGRLDDACSAGFSALQRAEIAEILEIDDVKIEQRWVSVLFNEPKLLKSASAIPPPSRARRVSVLFNEPKLLKCLTRARLRLTA